MIMNFRIFALLMALIFGAHLYVQSKPSATLPLGTWKVTQITSEKDTEGKIETTRYKSTADVKDYIRFPQTIEVKDSLTIVLSYFDREEKSMASYILEGDTLSIIEGPLRLIYLYELKDSEFVLTMESTYVNRKWDDNSSPITEIIAQKWIFILKIQK